MKSWIARHPLPAAMAGLLLLFLLMSTVKIVPETQQGVRVRFGKPVAIINPYRPGVPFGAPGAGITFRTPFVDQIVWIDKRVLDVDMEQQQVVSTDQRRLNVDAFARYRVVDPLRMYIAARDVEGVQTALRPILGSRLRDELGKRSFASLLSPEREGAMDSIRKSLDQVARQYGVQIVDVRIKKADLPDDAPLQSAFEAMRTARRQEALSIRAQGDKEASIIRAEADAGAARIYAAAFGKDPEFYDFYRAMQSYRTTFLGNGRDKPPPTNVILSPQNEYLRKFSGR